MGKDSDLTRRDVFALAALGLAAGAPRMVAAAPRKSAVSGHSFDRVGAALFDPKQPLKSDIVQPHSVRIATQVMRRAGRRLCRCHSAKESVDCRSEQSQPAFINKLERARGRTAWLEQEGRQTWET